MEAILQGKFKLNDDSIFVNVGRGLQRVAALDKHGVLLVAKGNKIHILSIGAVEVKFDSGDAVQDVDYNNSNSSRECYEIAFPQDVDAMAVSASERLLAVHMQGWIKIIEVGNLLALELRVVQDIDLGATNDDDRESINNSLTFNWNPSDIDNDNDNGLVNEMLAILPRSGTLHIVSPVSGLIQTVTERKCSSFAWRAGCDEGQGKKGSPRQLVAVAEVGSPSRVSILDCSADAETQGVGVIATTAFSPEQRNVGASSPIRINFLKWFDGRAILVGYVTDSSSGDDADVDKMAVEALLGLLQVSESGASKMTLTTVASEVMVGEADCPERLSPRNHLFDAHFLPAWSLLLVHANLSSEVFVIEYTPDKEPFIRVLELDPAVRLIDDDYDPCFPGGAAISSNASKEVYFHDGYIPPCPLLVVLSQGGTEKQQLAGVLNVYSLADRNKPKYPVRTPSAIVAKRSAIVSKQPMVVLGGASAGVGKIESADVKGGPAREEKITAQRGAKQEPEVTLAFGIPVTTSLDANSNLFSCPGAVAAPTIPAAPSPSAFTPSSTSPLLSSSPLPTSPFGGFSVGSVPGAGGSILSGPSASLNTTLDSFPRSATSVSNSAANSAVNSAVSSAVNSAANGPNPKAHGGSFSLRAGGRGSLTAFRPSSIFSSAPANDSVEQSASRPRFAPSETFIQKQQPQQLQREEQPEAGLVKQPPSTLFGALAVGTPSSLFGGAGGEKTTLGNQNLSVFGTAIDENFAGGAGRSMDVSASSTTSSPERSGSSKAGMKGSAGSEAGGAAIGGGSVNSSSSSSSGTSSSGRSGSSSSGSSSNGSGSDSGNSGAATVVSRPPLELSHMDAHARELKQLGAVTEQTAEAACSMETTLRGMKELYQIHAPSMKQTVKTLLRGDSRASPSSSSALCSSSSFIFLAANVPANVNVNPNTSMLAMSSPTGYAAASLFPVRSPEGKGLLFQQQQLQLMQQQQQQQQLSLRADSSSSHSSMGSPQHQQQHHQQQLQQLPSSVRRDLIFNREGLLDRISELHSRVAEVKAITASSTSSSAWQQLQELVGADSGNGGGGSSCASSSSSVSASGSSGGATLLIRSALEMCVQELAQRTNHVMRAISLLDGEESTHTGSYGCGSGAAADPVGTGRTTVGEARAGRRAKWNHLAKKVTANSYYKHDADNLECKYDYEVVNHQQVLPVKTK